MLDLTPLTIEFICLTLDLTVKACAILISKMSGKLAGLHAINTDPRQNPYCESRYLNKIGICEHCYSQGMARTHRKNAADRWKDNGEILALGILPDLMLPILNAAYFRYSAHGELLNTYHALNLWNIARKNPHCTFSLWSKRKDIIKDALQYQDKPTNLILVYSQTELNKIPTVDDIPVNFDKIFAVVDSEEHAHQINCGKNKCLTCLKCYSQDTPNVIIEQLSKRSQPLPKKGL